MKWTIRWPELGSVKEGAERITIGDERGVHIATIYTGGIPYKPSRAAVANALLIAAAPKLLEALTAIVEALDDKSGPGKDAGRGAVYWDDGEADAARAAIAKATGSPQ